MPKPSGPSSPEREEEEQVCEWGGGKKQEHCVAKPDSEKADKFAGAAKMVRRQECSRAMDGEAETRRAYVRAEAEQRLPLRFLEP
ncbi:hypothetical protein Tco_0794812 [Tanacetum coccineum]